jgi:hypothetical protein
LCEKVPRQKAAERRKIPESGSVIPREGVESPEGTASGPTLATVIPREGVESEELPFCELRHQTRKVIPREGVESLSLKMLPSFLVSSK